MVLSSSSLIQGGQLSLQCAKTQMRPTSTKLWTLKAFLKQVCLDAFTAFNECLLWRSVQTFLFNCTKKIHPSKWRPLSVFSHWRLTYVVNLSLCKNKNMNLVFWLCAIHIYQNLCGVSTWYIGNVLVTTALMGGYGLPAGKNGKPWMGQTDNLFRVCPTFPQH